MSRKSVINDKGLERQLMLRREKLARLKSRGPEAGVEVRALELEIHAIWCRLMALVPKQ